MTIAITLHNRHGSLVRVHLLSTDRVCCPVCGSELDCSGEELRTFLFGAIGSCHHCHTHLGVTDVPDTSEAHQGFDQTAEWKRLRSAWLKKNNWNPELVKQVENRLEVHVDVPPRIE